MIDILFKKYRTPAILAIVGFLAFNYFQSSFQIKSLHSEKNIKKIEAWIDTNRLMPGSRIPQEGRIVVKSIKAVPRRRSMKLENLMSGKFRVDVEYSAESSTGSSGSLRKVLIMGYHYGVWTIDREE